MVSVDVGNSPSPVFTMITGAIIAFVGVLIGYGMGRASKQVDEE